MACLPGITVAAIFTSMILLDLYKGQWRRIPGNVLLGIFALLLILFICERTSEGVAWMLILAPFLFAILGWMIHELVLKLYGHPSDSNRGTIEPKSNCSCCNQRPCRRRPYPEPKPCPRPCPKPCPRPEPKPEPEPSQNCIKPTLDT